MASQPAGRWLRPGRSGSGSRTWVTSNWGTARWSVVLLGARHAAGGRGTSLISRRTAVNLGHGLPLRRVAGQGSSSSVPSTRVNLMQARGWATLGVNPGWLEAAPAAAHEGDGAEDEQDDEDDDDPLHLATVGRTCAHDQGATMIDLAPLAQLAEQQTLNLRVRGSSPWRRTPD